MSTLIVAIAQELEIKNPLFIQHIDLGDTPADTADVGTVSKYYDGANTAYTGLFRDASDGTYKLFHGLQDAPDVAAGLIDTAGAGFALADLSIGALTTASDVVISGNLTVSGTTTSINVETVLVEDNLIVANAGPDGMKEDGGFVVKRVVTGVDDDVPLESGTASASGSTTAIVLQAANGHGTTLDYYKGWVIKLGGDATGTATITASTASDPPTLTFDTAASGATGTSTTYQLYNKHHVGMVFDESADLLAFCGFPREDGETTIGAGGNVVEYVDIRAKGVYAEAFYGPISIDDNILAINTTTPLEDTGFVAMRSAVNVVAADTPKLAALAINSNYTNGTTIEIITDESTTGYFNGWIISDSVAGEARTILASTALGEGVYSITLSAEFTNALTGGTDTVDLFNKRFVGTVYDESHDELRFLGFPREDEAVIDVESPVAGNVPDYLDVGVGNLKVYGAMLAKYMTQASAATLTAAQIKKYDVVYLNPDSATVQYTLPEISSLGLASGEVALVCFVNVHAANEAQIVPANLDTIEGTALQKLTRQWFKITLMAAPAVASTWLVRG